jgi:RimJ/RimL family protein N-acetyltransferase
MTSLESNRLILREWLAKDLSPFTAMNADPEVMRYFPEPLSHSKSEHLFESYRKGLNENKFGIWAVELKASGNFIGCVGLAIPNFQAHFTPCTEIGWRLQLSAWGKGYAAEAAGRVLDHALGELSLYEVVACTSLLNERSMRVMERIGMVRDRGGDFDHPKVPDRHRLKRHALFRKTQAPLVDADELLDDSGRRK